MPKCSSVIPIAWWMCSADRPMNAPAIASRVTRRPGNSSTHAVGITASAVPATSASVHVRYQSASPSAIANSSHTMPRNSRSART